MRLVALILAGLLAGAALAEPAETPRPRGLHAFVAAYPEHLEGVEGDTLVWRDGTRMTFADLGIPSADARAVIAAGAEDDPRLAAAESVSAVDYAPIYARMYGDCRAGEVTGRLAPVRWNRGAADGGVIVHVTAVNGVAERLQRVSDALDGLGPEVAAFLRPLGGTYACRTIALTQRLSLHSHGIAIDLNPAEGDYWLTAPRDADGHPIRRDRVPAEIVAAFESEGFVWGGRWHRFDTFHFEYRPEYRVAAGPDLPERLTTPRFAHYFGRRAGSGGGAPGTAAALLAARRTTPCFQWVRQPGPNFGRCLRRAGPPAPAVAGPRPDPLRLGRGPGPGPQIAAP